MRFFRRLSSPALAALLAIATQAMLLLAHAHTHPHASTMAGAATWGKTASIACRALVPPAGCAPAVPSDHHDDCPLCWSLAASGAGVLPSPLIVTADATPAGMLRPAPMIPLRREAGASQFQARGPPVA